MSESNAGKLPLIIVVLIAAAVAGYYFMSSNSSEPDVSVEVPQPEVVVEKSAEDMDPEVKSELETKAVEQDYDQYKEDNGVDAIVHDQEELKNLGETTEMKSVLDDGTPLPVRGIGNPNAPITIVEYSSLSCGHCAQFHQGTLEKIKEKYVGEGKVYMVFREFPLNKAAIDASKVLRCMPEDKYESFMNLLFETQGHWAFGGDHIGKLRQHAKLAGLNDEQIDTCLADKDMEEKLAASLKIGSEKYGVRSTPSFVVNGGEKLISGNQRFSFFEKVFDELLAAEAR